MATKARSKPRAKSRVKDALPAGYRRWDAANYLKSEEDMAGYLEAAMEEAPDDPAYITAVLNDIARARGIMKLANDAGMTRAGLYKALAPGSKPSFETVVKISKALGLRLSLKPAA
ncbi:addiction module antidote protein [Steroidobacter flavus]|uniref:Addiction module antidote protein n=1 Tax=Steroidobacter flavus TaxID=1842136 RepID=A0ABV8SJS9_9GAMM